MMRLLSRRKAGTSFQRLIITLPLLRSVLYLVVSILLKWTRKIFMFVADPPRINVHIFLHRAGDMNGWTPLSTKTEEIRGNNLEPSQVTSWRYEWYMDIRVLDGNNITILVENNNIGG